MYRKPRDLTPTDSTSAWARHLLAHIQDCDREMAALKAAQMESMAELVHLTGMRAGEDEEAHDDAQLSTEEEVALALNVAGPTAHARLDFATKLTTRLPRTFKAMRAGIITPAHARAALEETQFLTVEQCHRLEEGISPEVYRQTPGNLRRSFYGAVRAVDADLARKRAEKARSERSVGHSQGLDGMSSINAYLPAEQALAVFGVIDTLAQATKKALAPGDTRGIDAIRADVLVDLICNPNGEQRVRHDIRVLVPAGTLLGLGEQDGHIPGHGPIPAALCRQLATDNTWKRVLTDPNLAHVLDVGANTYAPSRRMREFIEARDQHCRFPGCRRPAHKSEIDHTIEFSIGSLTIRVNLSALCRKHHKVKHLPGWRLIQDPDQSGVLTWITPSGREYVTRPPTAAGQEVAIENPPSPWIEYPASPYDVAPF